MALTNAEIQQVLDAIAALGIKIGDLPDSDTLTGAELIEILQGGESKKVDLDSILALLGELPTGGEYTPVVSSVDTLNSGTATIPQDWKYIKVGDIVSVNGILTISGLDIGADSISAYITLPPDELPNNDWSFEQQIFGVINSLAPSDQINDLTLLADEDNPSKDIRINLAKDGSATGFVLVFNFTYNIDN
jgi:hypothetical protein